MIIKKYFLAFLLTLSLICFAEKDLFAQLPNQGMTLLANRNTHPGTGGNLYSAIWGYVAPNGREYAILGCATGTAFFDVTDSANIVEVGFISGPTSSWREMKVFSNYAYVVSEANNSRIQIINLANLPASVNLVTTSTMPGHTTTHTVSQEGAYLYLNGCNSGFGQGTVVVDLTNPTSPVKRGSWNTQYVHDSRILNDTIWAANIYDGSGGGTGSIYVISAVNKDNLSLINSWVNSPTPGPHNLAITGDRRFALTTDEIPQGTLPRQLKIWNVQNLSNVTQTAVWRPTGVGDSSIVHNVEIYGNYALIAHYTCGVRLVNITNPAVPVEVAWYDTYPSNNRHTYNGCWGVYMFPSGKIIASDRQTGLYVLKTTVPLVGINEQGNNAPDKFELKQNFPNPFNPTTYIDFNLKSAGHVTLKVTDILGRQVALLVDEYRNAGAHKISFDGGRLSSGIYFYSLTTDKGFSETKKMILNK